MSTLVDVKIRQPIVINKQISFQIWLYISESKSVVREIKNYPLHLLDAFLKHINKNSKVTIESGILDINYNDGLVIIKDDIQTYSISKELSIIFISTLQLILTFINKGRNLSDLY